MKQPQATRLSGDTAIRAIVGLVRGEGDRRFAVTYLDPGTVHPEIGKGESITFSLTDWKGDTEPRKEQVVLLEGVQLFAKGWRAVSARPIGLSLQPQATRKEPL